MGDRANVLVKDSTWDDNGVYLYTHWAGTELPETVRVAMASPQGRGRWTDSSYLARIIFDGMTAGQQGGETGFGISAKVGDGDDRVITVDSGTRTVTVNAYGVIRTCSFDEWVASPQKW